MGHSPDAAGEADKHSDVSFQLLVIPSKVACRAVADYESGRNFSLSTGAGRPYRQNPLVLQRVSIKVLAQNIRKSIPVPYVKVSLMAFYQKT